MVKYTWTREKDSPEYHLVAFRLGPNTQEEKAVCGKTAHFCPRIGLRMDDVYCSACAAGAKMELLLALYDHLSAEIGELHDKIDRLTKAIQEMKHG